MKKILYIFLAAVLALTACRQIDPESPLPVEKNAGDQKVPIEFNIALPTDGPATKVMGNKPDIKNIVLAVFGGSGYFNEWVKADASTEYATENEVIYKLSAKLSMSESRLRIHIIANCPEQYLDNPPITGVSNEDLEDVVLSKIRSKITEANNDGYWQKIYIPYGIAAQIDPDGNGANAYMTDASGNLIPTTLTINQFKMVSPIPLVRNFARIKLVNSAEDVTIHNVGLAFAPAEGVIAPILSTPYRVDEWGARVVEVTGAGHEDEHGWHDGETTVYPVKADRTYGADLPDAPKREDYNDDAAYNAAVEQYNVNVSNLIGGIHVLGHEIKNATTNADVLGAQFTGSVYSEDFVTNYQNLPLKAAPTDAEGNTFKLLTDAPYNYAGTAPANLTFAPNPTSNDDGTPATGFVEYDPNGYLYVYERPRPRTFSGKTEMATRIIIYATKTGEPKAKYYALDILEDGNYIPLLRNFTYSVELSSIAVGSGEDTAEAAATTTGSNVSSDPKTQDLNEVSDGTSTIRVSYVDITHIKSGTYDVYYQFIPDVKNNPNVQSNKDVTIDWGYDGGESGYVAHGVSANGSPFAMTAATEDEPNGVPSNLKIDMTGSEPTLYVPDGNDWKVATTAAERAVAWSRIEYTTSGEAGSAFDVATFGTIRVTGSRTNATLYRDVRVNVIPKKTMTVRCAQKYVQSIAGQPEDYIIRIPADITRSMFPLEFKIQAEAASLTPRDGDNLPVTSGKSIVEGKETQSAFCFIKTLTRQEYEALPLITDGNNSYKEFTCKFKTTKAASATKIYASNPYFNLAWDDFANFKQRLFTSNTLGNLSAGQEVTLKLTMDDASRTNDNNMVFDNATDGYTDSNQVIPHEVKITMVGIQPATNASGQIADENLVASQDEDGVYYYHPAKYGDRPDEYQKDLHLVAEGGEDSYSITFSTATCTNPDLYEEYAVTGNIIKAQITGSGFTNTSGGAITSIRREADLPVQFRFTYGGTPVPVTFKLQGLTPAAGSGVTGPDASGNYTYTPTGSTAARVINFTTTDATTECKLTDFAVASDYTEMYSQPNPNSFSLRRRNGYFSVKETAGTYGWTTSTVNPDSDMYYAYQSNNKGVSSSIATMRVTVVGYTEFTVYIRSYGESGYSTYDYDYTVARRIGSSALTSWSYYDAYSDSGTKAYTNSTSGSTLADYTAVTFTTADGLTDDDTPHTFYIQYGKDGSTNSGDDCGYVLIPKDYTYNESPEPITTTVTFSPSDFTFYNNNSSATKDGVTISFTQSMKDNGYIQIGRRGQYSGNNDGTMSVSPTSGMTITNVSMTFVDDSNYADPSKISSNPTGWNSTNREWSGSSSGNVTFTGTSVGGSGTNTRYNRITQIVVTLSE